MAVSQNERLEAVLSKLESIENELRQTKRIIQYYKLEEGSTRRDGEEITDRTVVSTPKPNDRDGLFQGQIDYQASERPSVLRAEAKQIEEEEVGTCAS